MKARAGDRGSIVWIPSALYQGIWDADLGEQLPCRREPTNSKDPFAVAVVKSHVTVGRGRFHQSVPCFSDTVGQSTVE